MSSPEPPFGPLFGGRSAEAWRAYRGDDFPAESWRVEGGLLVAVPGAPRVDLVTRDQFGSFVLEFEWRVGHAGNSGVLYLVTEDEEHSWRSGPEMQLLDDDGHPDGRVPETSAGALYGLVAPGPKTLHPAGEFNSARVVVRGRRVEHWLNGERVLACDLDGAEFRARVVRSKFRDCPGFARAPRGHIALQHHGEGAWFRALRVAALPEGT